MTPRQYWGLWLGLTVLWFVAARFWLVEPILQALAK